MAGAGAVAGKVIRDGLNESERQAAWVLGVLPNFLPALVLPTLIFLRPREVTWGDYLRMTGAVALGLAGYESAQLWMPRRTFDWADVAATAVGAALALALGRLMFFRRSTATTLKGGR